MSFGCYNDLQGVDGLSVESTFREVCAERFFLQTNIPKLRTFDHHTFMNLRVPVSYIWEFCNFPWYKNYIYNYPEVVYMKTTHNNTWFLVWGLNMFKILQYHICCNTLLFKQLVNTLNINKDEVQSIELVRPRCHERSPH